MSAHGPLCPMVTGAEDLGCACQFVESVRAFADGDDLAAARKACPGRCSLCNRQCVAQVGPGPGPAPSDMGRAVSWLQKWVYNGDDGPNLNGVLAAEFAEVRRETIDACAAVIERDVSNSHVRATMVERIRALQFTSAEEKRR